jgi:valyl-tRNA synthetase
MVTEAFVRLFDAGLIYRDTRLVNWCCQLQTVISDIEIEHMQVDGPTVVTLRDGMRKMAASRVRECFV